MTSMIGSKTQSLIAIVAIEKTEFALASIHRGTQCVVVPQARL
jgi:hypothetical protein